MLWIKIRLIAREEGLGVSIESPFQSQTRVYYISIHTCVYLYKCTSEPGSHSRFWRDCITLLKFKNSTLGYQLEHHPFCRLVHIFCSFGVVDLVGVDKKSGCGRENFSVCLCMHKMQPPPYTNPGYENHHS